MKGLLTSILTVLTFTGLQAQPLPSTPKLVVGLTIDQLRTDYLEAFSTLYGDRGFRRLWKEGRVFRNAEYTFSGTDRASAIAAIYTGTTPSVNGIIGKRWMDVSTLRTVSCVDDPAFMGNYTNESSSPSHLLTSTIADELKIATRNEGLVYAIAPFRDAAILAAGHAGNGAFWLNNTTGKWCGTTYYSEFPWWVSQYNDRNAIDFRIADMTWTPVHPVQSYSFLPEWRDAAFKYKFDDDRVNKYKRLITSPFINDEINTLTEELLDKSTMGKDHVPDMLALTYYAGNYAHKSVQECAMEMQDTYVRLDRSIASLLDIIDKKVGLQCCFLYYLHRIYRYRITRPGTLPGSDRRISPEPLRSLAEHVSDGYLRAGTVCGSILRSADLSESQTDRRKTTESGGYTGKSRRISDPVQRSE